MLKSRWTAPLLALWFSAAPPCQEASAPGSAYAGPWERDHERTLGGTQLRYRSVVDYVPLRAGGDEVVAELFHTAYFVVDGEGEADPSRPLIFAYNGGPGSASYWLHIGVMGPRRVVTAEVGPQGAPPYALEDNPASLLDVADIVMVDVLRLIDRFDGLEDKPATRSYVARGTGRAAFRKAYEDQMHHFENDADFGV